MKRLIVLLAIVTAFVGAGTASAARFVEPGEHTYEVLWTVQCPRGALCKLAGETLVKNYGQALKLERLLLIEGYRVGIVRVW